MAEKYEGFLAYWRRLAETVRREWNREYREYSGCFITALGLAWLFFLGPVVLLALNLTGSNMMPFIPLGGLTVMSYGIYLIGSEQEG